MNPNSPNPYVPWNPIGAVLGPLALISGSHARKKTKNLPKWLSLITLLLLSCITASAAGTMFDSCWDYLFPSNSAPEAPATSTQGVGTEAPATVTPAITTTPAPTETPIDSVCPCGPETREDVITGVTRVLYKEGASSFPDFNSSLTVFERLAWATRSIKIHPETSSDSDYETLVQSSRYSAAGEYNTPFGNEEPYRNIARKILSEENPSSVPPEIKDNFVQWISPQLFPRRAGGLVQIFVDPEVPGCGWSDPQICQLPDLRYLSDFRNSAISSLTEERFIELGELNASDESAFIGNIEYDKPDNPHDGANDGKVVYEQPYYFENECYWVGIYFMNRNEHTALVNLSRSVANSYPYPTSADADKLSCPSN